MIEYIESQSSSQTPRNRLQKHPLRQQKNPNTAQSRAKLALMRSKSKQTFLTDPQTSDHTQKSTSSAKIRIQILEQKLNKLHKENSELRQQIITMKANQFYTINEQKVKMAIQQNEKLRKEICQIRKMNEELQIQNEFLQRNNKNLKEKLEEVTNDNLRKSVDMGKSRMRQNTARTINKKNETNHDDMNGMILQDVDKRNPLQYSSTKYQKKTVEHVKSNPNLMRYWAEEQPDCVAISGQQKQHKKRQRQSNPLQPSNQHFLREFQKYQKQLTSNNSSNRNTVNTLYSSRGDGDFKGQSHNRDWEKARGVKLQSTESRSKRSNSKESSLQAILNRKKELMNRKDRNEKGYDGGNYRQNDENCMGLGNCVGKQTFNEQYLIGKTAKYPSPNHQMPSTHSSPSQRLNHEYGGSKRNYRS